MSTETVLLGPDEVSTWLRIPKSSLYKLCKAGEIPCVKVGKHWRFDADLLKAWFTEKMRRRIKSGFSVKRSDE